MAATDCGEQRISMRGLAWAPRSSARLPYKCARPPRSPPMLKMLKIRPKCPFAPLSGQISTRSPPMSARP
eukprot:5802751-Pyramimonas_sp.AAC.1